jgi:hypothetical protein
MYEADVLRGFSVQISKFNRLVVLLRSYTKRMFMLFWNIIVRLTTNVALLRSYTKRIVMLIGGTAKFERLECFVMMLILS